MRSGFDSASARCGCGIPRTRAAGLRREGAIARRTRRRCAALRSHSRPSDIRLRSIVGWSFHLEIDLAVNNVDDVAADPDFLAALAQMDAAGTLEGSALGRNIGRLGESCADEPLREARVEAAGDRVFVSAAADE